MQKKYFKNIKIHKIFLNIWVLGMGMVIFGYLGNPNPNWVWVYQIPNPKPNKYPT